MFYVYRGTNRTQREIYYGVSKSPRARINGSHCQGGTVAVRHWDCASDSIAWTLVSKHADQSVASAKAHALERRDPPAGYYIIPTAGI